MPHLAPFRRLRMDPGRNHNPRKLRASRKARLLHRSVRTFRDLARRLPLPVCKPTRINILPRRFRRLRACSRTIRNQNLKRGLGPLRFICFLYFNPNQYDHGKTRVQSQVQGDRRGRAQMTGTVNLARMPLCGARRMRLSQRWALVHIRAGELQLLGWATHPLFPGVSFAERPWTLSSPVQRPSLINACQVLRNRHLIPLRRYLPRLSHQFLPRRHHHNLRHLYQLRRVCPSGIYDCVAPSRMRIGTHSRETRRIFWRYMKGLLNALRIPSALLSERCNGSEDRSRAKGRLTISDWMLNTRLKLRFAQYAPYSSRRYVLLDFHSFICIFLPRAITWSRFGSPPPFLVTDGRSTIPAGPGN